MMEEEVIMLHLLRGPKNACYFLERPWGNLVIYEVPHLSDSDWEHLKGRGGVFRQFLLDPANSSEMAKKLFDRFGASVVTPHPAEFTPAFPVEQIGVDFVDPGIQLLHSLGIMALEVIIKDKRYVFTDRQLSLIQGELIHERPENQNNASGFLKNLIRPVTVLTPFYRGKNFIVI